MMRPSCARASACNACLRAYSSALDVREIVPPASAALLPDTATVLKKRSRFLRERNHSVYDAPAENILVRQIFADNKRAKPEISCDGAVRVGFEAARHARERFALFGDLQTVALQ